MKKILIFLILTAAAFAQAAADVEGAADQAATFIQILLNGDPIGWLAACLGVIGLGRVWVAITPSKEDDKWYNSKVVAPFNKIITVFGLGGRKDK